MSNFSKEADLAMAVIEKTAIFGRKIWTLVNRNVDIQFLDG